MGKGILARLVNLPGCLVSLDSDVVGTASLSVLRLAIFKANAIVNAVPLGSGA